MTIAVTVKIGSAVIFAADSKVTTSGVIGRDEQGNLRWVEQTYDNATKIVHDRSRKVMAMIAGDAIIGQESAMDFLMSKNLQHLSGCADQDRGISEFVDSMMEQKKSFWESMNIPPENWRGPIVLIATFPPSGYNPRIWRIDLQDSGSTYMEILKDPGIYLEGSYNETFGLLYGYERNVLGSLMTELGVEMNTCNESLGKLKVLRPIEKLSLWSMPLQDAIDLAVFLATVQIQMDRFLPGTPACGGPIDVMVLQTVPDHGILMFPGKEVHHPFDQ